MAHALPRPMCPDTVADALDRAALLVPEVEAVVAGDGRATFAELRDEVGRVASAMAAAGVRRGDHVGLCLGNSLRWITLFYAAATLGAVLVPVNTRLKAPEIAYALRTGRVSHLFIADRVLKIDFLDTLRRMIPGVETALPDPDLPELSRIVICGGRDIPAACTGWEAFLAGAGEAPAPRAEPGDDMLIQYTSGTTSLPKAVMLRQGPLMGNGYVSGMRVGLRPGDRMYSARPFFHVAGTTLSVLSCLQNLATLVTMERFEPEGALALMEAEGCTHFSGNETIATMLLNHPSRPERRLALRGAWLAASRDCIERVMEELGAREAVIGYGLSEASPNAAQSCFWEEREIRASGAMRAQPGVEIAIRDEAGRALPTGREGEIHLRGYTLMREYFGDAEATAATIDAEGWLSTGDLGRLDESGRLHFVGRLKEILRVGGENVAPADIESVLMQHPQVDVAQVVGVPDARLVEVPAAYVVPRGPAPEPEALTAWLKERLAGFKLPRHLWVIADFSAIGMTESGKVQKTALREDALRRLAEEA